MPSREPPTTSAHIAAERHLAERVIRRCSLHSPPLQSVYPRSAPALRLPPYSRVACPPEERSRVSSGRTKTGLSLRRTESIKSTGRVRAECRRCAVNICRPLIGQDCRVTQRSSCRARRPVSSAAVVVVVRGRARRSRIVVSVVIYCNLARKACSSSSDSSSSGSSEEIAKRDHFLEVRCSKLRCN